MFKSLLQSPKFNLNSFESERDRIIKSLAHRYKNRYDQKLDERIVLDLELSYTQQGTDKLFVDRYFAKQAKTEAELQKALAELVKEFHYILIVGQPGAGKTTLLLDTAISLLYIAKEQGLPVPVIFNLSSWRKNNTDFSTWLVDMLVEGNGFSRKLAEEAITKNHITPLLDGFDELGRSLTDENERQLLRGQCLEAIHKFLQDKNPQYMIICSRLLEYKSIKKNAPVKAEILVNPFHIEQLKRVLKPLAERPFREINRPFANPTAAQNILHLLETTPSVKETLCVPFYFHLATQVFDNQLIDDSIPIEKKAFENYLVETFVEKKLSFSKSKTFENVDSNRYWLSWLARKLNEQEMTWFEITFLQPFMLQRPKMYTLYVYFLFTGLLFQIANCGFSNRVGVSGLGLAMVIAGKRGNFFSTSKILLFEKKIRRLSILKDKRVILVTLFVAVINIIVLQTIYTGIFLTLIIGIILPCIVSWLIFSEVNIPYSSLHKPYQRVLSGFISQPLKYTMIVLSISLPVTLVYSGWSTLIINKILIITSCGFCFGMALNPIFRHIIVRYLFWAEGVIPIRYVHFLNYTTGNLHFLEQDGGSWRFRHQILQDYFANLKNEIPTQ